MVWRMGRQDQFSKPVGSTQQDCQILRLQNAETTQLDGTLRFLALSSRLLVVSLSPTHDSIIPLDYRRACSILEHQTDDRKFIKHYDYHSEVVLSYEENPRILIWCPSQPHPPQTWGPSLSSQGKGRVPLEFAPLLERVEMNVNSQHPCALGAGLRRLPRAPLSCSH